MPSLERMFHFLSNDVPRRPLSTVQCQCQCQCDRLQVYICTYLGPGELAQDKKRATEQRHYKFMQRRKMPLRCPLSTLKRINFVRSSRPLGSRSTISRAEPPLTIVKNTSESQPAAERHERSGNNHTFLTQTPRSRMHDCSGLGVSERESQGGPWSW